MYTVSPRDTERYSLRILLLNTKGKTSFEDLRTIDGTMHANFVDAAKAAGFLDDDRYLRQSLHEAVQYQSAATTRSFFVCLLCFCDVVNAQDLWDEFAESMSDDYIHQGIDLELAVSLAYFDVQDRMSLLGMDLTRIVTPPARERPLSPTTVTDYVAYERNGLRQYETLNPMQRAAADSILLHWTVMRVVPSSMLCTTGIVNEIFGAVLDPDNPSQLCECAILAPKNIHVQHLNEQALDRLRVPNPEDERCYRSIDEAIYSEGRMSSSSPWST
ncbi:hypothetical protein OSTOST_02663 [Ostertagia ostertagi]